MGLNRMFVRDAQCALLCYDVNNPDSLTAVTAWLNELENSAPSKLVLALCGNKIDTPLPHKVSSQQGTEFAFQNKISIFQEVSAKSKQNLQDLL